ncbi:ShlB/FhaC/HecB family hemolysin secretion/activation protein, partial [Coleofasciculus sp. LEGE 07081]|uniref:ShlB/FhaC/HecB family hemolysin secretion/activation protein n=1 Tax=Coleofasciculus sp. LEGE 07081 TaxID=2777967 RepID=UPI00187E78E5
PPASDPPLAAVPEQICIQGFDFNGNTVFSDSELNTLIRQQLPPNSDTNPAELCLPFAQVLQARSIITQHYIKYQYPLAFAYIPEGQEVRLGGTDTITINIVEGQLEKPIQINGTQRLKPSYLRSRLAAATSAPLNQDRLLEALRLLQLNPLIETINAELLPGSQPGQALLEVDITETQPFDIQVSLDNNRSPSVGSFRRNLTLSHGNLFGLGDNLTATYRNTDGSNEVDIGYTLPINAKDGTLGLRYRLGSGDVTEPPFDKLDLAADYRSYELTLRQPIIRKAEGDSVQELGLGLTFSRQESDTSILGFKFPLSRGADAAGRTRISALRFFQDWTQRSSREVFVARSEFSLGVDWFNATLNDTDPFTGEEIPDSRFFSWRGQVQWGRRIAPDTTLLLRSSIQLANDPLIPLEQLGLGGQNSVRGYRQDARLTDNGIFASAELQLPIYRLSNPKSVVSIIPFIDLGIGWNSGGQDTPNPNTLVGIGLGLQWQQSDRFRTRLDWGIPLVEVDSRDRTWQENGVYFTVEYNFF